MARNEDQGVLFTPSGEQSIDLSWIAPDQPSFECRGGPAIIEGIDGQVETLLPCGWVLPFDCFRPKHAGASYGAPGRPVRSRCVECEERIRTARNRLNFWGRRMSNAVRRHYRIERKESLHAAADFPRYLLLTGIDLPELAKRARLAAEEDQQCQHCQKHWSQFPGGAVMHLSLDRRDTSRLLTMDNYALNCRTGNSQYARVSPRVRTIRDAMYRIKAEHGVI